MPSTREELSCATDGEAGRDLRRFVSHHRSWAVRYAPCTHELLSKWRMGPVNMAIGRPVVTRDYSKAWLPAQVHRHRTLPMTAVMAGRTRARGLMRLLEAMLHVVNGTMVHARPRGAW